MATTSPEIQPQARIPFWRDVRVIAVVAQVVFVVLVLLGIAWLIRNFLINAEQQGLQLGFEFLRTTAAFDLSEGIEYSATDTFGRALWVGLVNTIRVSLLGIILTTFLGVFAGIARLSNNWLVSKVAEAYIELLRNVPLLVLLFFLYFAVVLKLPAVRDSIQPFGLPIYLNQRGVAIPSLAPTSGFPLWLAFIVLGLILALAVWMIQSRLEEQSGEPMNKGRNALLAFLIIAAGGWFVVSAFNSGQGFMAPARLNLADLDDWEDIYLARFDEDALAEAGAETEALDSLSTPRDIAIYRQQLEFDITELDAALDAAEELEEDLTELEAELAVLEAQMDVLDETEITVCGVEGSVALVYTGSRLRQQGLNLDVSDSDTMREAGEEYASGDCDMLVGPPAQLAAERSTLEDATDHAIVGITVPPMVTDVPVPAGFNIQGGFRLSPEFFALLAGLVLYTGAFAAEIVRAGILSVSKGQTEAARALGLNEGQRLRLIVLPQALRVIIPPMTSQYLNLTKNSSLGVAIAFPELVSVGNTVMNQSGLAVQVIILFMVSYLSLSLAISAFLNWYNKKVALVER